VHQEFSTAGLANSFGIVICQNKEKIIYSDNFAWMVSSATFLNFQKVLEKQLTNSGLI
jgi:hypothetical protein